MLAALTAALILGQINQQDIEGKWEYIGDPSLATTHIALYTRQARLDPPKYSPKKFGKDDPQPYEFDWLTAGYGRLEGDHALRMRVRVFSQERKGTGDKAPSVARMLMRLWDLKLKNLKTDHPLEYNNSIVDVYLCWGGTPGGEQEFAQDVEGSPPSIRKADTIYIYDLASFTDPVESAREVAHEYGHATLPAVGGFVQPEDWGNGFLGEKLFLRWVRNEMRAQHLGPEDAMGATLPALDAWVRKNVDPLVNRTGVDGPFFSMLEGQGQASMDAYIGLALYAETILPESVFARSLKLTGSAKASDYPAAIVSATEEKGRVVVEIPPALQGKDFWVPVGAGKVVGAHIVKKQNGWAMIHPNPIGAITIVGPGS
jgi:hypothetical protein